MKLRIFSGSLHSKTAGLSPIHDERIELFLAGCKIAREGHPCHGCFNSALWDDKYGREQEISEVIAYILHMTENRFITIVGGEPLDQYFAVTLLAKELQKHAFHIVLITHFTMKEIKKDFPKVLPYVNLLIDGKYDKRKRIFDSDPRAGVRHVIGSSNQRIWFRNGDNFVDVTEEQNLRPYWTERR